jgi:RNA polymerase subunit RPABC4/transcription elongation factor Spt4
METIATLLRYVLAFLVAYTISLWVALAIWAYFDIRSRTTDLLVQLFSVLLVLAFNVFGLILYLFLRPKETLAEANVLALEEESYLVESEGWSRCPNCRRHIKDDYQICPMCQTELRKRCTGCRNLVDLQWNACAYCGSAVD